MAMVDDLGDREVLSLTLTALAWIDTWALSASLRSRLPLFEERTPGWATINIRQGGKYTDDTLADKWRPLTNVVARISRLSKPPPIIESIRLDKLDASAASGWENSSHPIAVLPIVTNPGAWHFCGATAQVIPTGQLTAFDPRLPRCALNLWRDNPTIYMVVEYRGRDIEDE